MKCLCKCLLAIVSATLLNPCWADESNPRAPAVGTYRLAFQIDRRSRLPAELAERGDAVFQPIEQSACLVYPDETGHLTAHLPEAFLNNPEIQDGRFTFRADLSEQLSIMFSGQFDSKSNVKGKGKSADGAVTAAFTFTRIGPLNMADGVDISMPDGDHFKTGSAFEAGKDAKAISDKKIIVDLSTPERTATEIVRASNDQDINRLWACTSDKFKKDMMQQIGGTEAEAKRQLRNWMFDADAPKLQSGEIVGKRMVDETHCAVHVKWVVVGAGPQAGVPIQLVKEKEEWRLLKLH